jgi:hypothetical protein
MLGTTEPIDTLRRDGSKWLEVGALMWAEVVQK